MNNPDKSRFVVCLGRAYGSGSPNLEKLPLHSVRRGLMEVFVAGADAGFALNNQLRDEASSRQEIMVNVGYVEACVPVPSDVRWVLCKWLGCSAAGLDDLLTWKNVLWLSKVPLDSESQTPVVWESLKPRYGACLATPGGDSFIDFKTSWMDTVFGSDFFRRMDAAIQDSLELEILLISFLTSFGGEHSFAGTGMTGVVLASCRFKRGLLAMCHGIPGLCGSSLDDVKYARGETIAVIVDEGVGDEIAQPKQVNIQMDFPIIAPIVFKNLKKPVWVQRCKIYMEFCGAETACGPPMVDCMDEAQKLVTMQESLGDSERSDIYAELYEKVFLTFDAHIEEWRGTLRKADGVIR
jgi:hypothetical protein